MPDIGTDLAAQLAKASFAREAPLAPFDFSWYAGVHPFGYSVLSPILMAVFGVAACGLVSAVVSAVVFARLVRDTARPWAAGLSGSVFWVFDVGSGRITFALGATAGLLAVAALPREEPYHRRRLVAVGALAVLCALLSPVSAAFLGLVAAVLVLHRRPGGWTMGVASTLPVVAVFLAFPGGGIQPFSASWAIPSIALMLLVAYLTEYPLVRTAALLYAASMLFFAGHDDPFGSNVMRLGWVIGLPVLLATTATRWPKLMLLTCAGLLVWQSDSIVGDLVAEPSPPTVALTAELQRRDSHRVEVVGARDHRESWSVAEVVPVARGWSRQLDFEQNGLFYVTPLRTDDYVQWLRDHSVDHVATPRRGDIDYGSRQEAELLEGPVPGLRQVWQDQDWTLFAVERPVPLVQGPATVVESSPARLVITSPGQVRVRVDVGWTRWLSLSGPACLERVGRRAYIRFDGPGTVVLSSSFRPRGHC